MSLQHVVGLLLIPLVAVAGQRWFGRVAALLAATLVSIAPSFFAIEDDALPDFFLAVFLTIAALAIAAATDPSRSNRRYAILAGAAIATIVLIKPVGWVLLLAMPATILLCDQHPRRALRLGMVTAATTLALLSPWVIHDLIRYQSPVLSGGGGIALFNRVFAVDKQPLPERNAIEKQLAAELRSAPPESRSTFVALDALNRMGLAREAKAIMGASPETGLGPTRSGGGGGRSSFSIATRPKSSRATSTGPPCWPEPRKLPGQQSGSGSSGFDWATTGTY